jgi:hypothetical protein
MKKIEQRIEELEREVILLKAKNKLQETKTVGFVNKQPIRVPLNKEINDYMFNSSVNLMSEPDLETAFASPWDSSEMIKNPLDTITVNLNPIASGTYPNPNYTDSSDLPEYYPPYPDIIGSWNDNFKDTIWQSISDTNSNETFNSLGFESEFDKSDKAFLEFLNKTTLDKKIENNFGKIISKFRILNLEWEMDGYGYIVSDIEYNKNIIVTNHGKPMVVNKSYLNDVISTYKETIQETERALFLIK